MASPPRIPNWLPRDSETLYFVTLCVEGREYALASNQVWKYCQHAIDELKRWTVQAVVVMPDHIHFLVWPHDRDLGVDDFSKGFKYLMTRKLKPTWRWQKGCFDRLLRTEESAQEKWKYMRQNPVRAGLVSAAGQWPYQFLREDLL